MLFGDYDIECPYCGSHAVNRVHRGGFEKLLRRNPKYRCHKCKCDFFRKRPAEKDYRKPARKQDNGKIRRRISGFFSALILTATVLAVILALLYAISVSTPA